MNDYECEKHFNKVYRPTMNNIWPENELIEDKERQIQGIDLISADGLNIDNKFDRYDNDNFVYEISNEHHLYENAYGKGDKKTDIIAYWKIATGKLYLYRYEDIVRFATTKTFKERYTHQVNSRYHNGSLTKFKVFHCEEIPYIAKYRIKKDTDYAKESKDDNWLYYGINY